MIIAKAKDHGVIFAGHQQRQRITSDQRTREVIRVQRPLGTEVLWTKNYHIYNYVS